MKKFVYSIFVFLKYFFIYGMGAFLGFLVLISPFLLLPQFTIEAVIAGGLGVGLGIGLFLGLYEVYYYYED